MTKSQNPIFAVYDRLDKAGIKRNYVRKVILPEWWNDEVAQTKTGFLQGVGIIARHLGLELMPLHKNGKVEFQTQKAVNFKKTPGVSEAELSLAQNIATQALWLTCFQTQKPFDGIPNSPAAIRQEILKSGNEAVNLKNLLEYCWSKGVVVLHVSNFPVGVKKMEGLATLHNGRPGIVLCKNLQSSSWMVFLLAHELGHIACGHVKKQGVLVDEKIDPESQDAEEKEANRFAIELLTGNPDMRFTAPYRLTAEQLAEAAKSVGRRVQVDPGVVALNYAWQKKFYALANDALKQIEPPSSAVDEVHRQMQSGLQWDDIPESNREYIEKVTDSAVQS
jgi:Zn-dependent peptidase ImmA (M78 family)